MSSSDPGLNPSEPARAPAAGSDGKSPRRRGWGPLRIVFGYTRALILDQRLRRTTMFYVVIADMVMVFVGATFLDDWLDARANLSRFLVYWLVVSWLTVLAALLAVYDLLLLRLQHRLLRRKLRAHMVEEEAREQSTNRGEE